MFARIGQREPKEDIKLVKKFLTLFMIFVIIVGSSTFAIGATPDFTGMTQKQIEDYLQAQINDYGQELVQTIQDLQAQITATPTPKPAAPKIKVQEPAVITLKDTSARTSQITLKNVGTGQASNVLVQFEIPATAPLIVYFTESTNYIRSIRASGTADVKLRIEPNKNAASGTYPITLKYTYVDENNKEITDTDIIYIKLDNASSSANVILYQFNNSKQIIKAGDVFTIEALLENTGNVAATDVQVVIDGLKANEIYLSGSAGNHFFREIDSKGTKSVSFQLNTSEKTKQGTYPLTFKVAYKDDQGEQKENTYTYYAVISSGVTESSDKARIKTGQVSYPSSQVGVGQDFSVVIPITNTGLVTSPSVTIIADAGVDGMIVPKSANAIVLNDFEPGKTQELTFVFAATSKSESRNYAIGFTVKYETGALTDEDAVEYQSFMQYVGVNVNNPESDKKDEDKKSVPKIIISRYESDPIVVKAGQNFDLNIAFLNTHSERMIKNVKAYLTAVNETEKKGNVFTPVGASNTFYIDEIAPKSEVEEHLTFYTVPDADPRNYIITVNFEYEDEEGTEYKSTEQFGINVKQTTKIDTGDINIPTEGFVGQPISVYFDFFNTGKVTLSNLLIKMEGEFDMSNTSSYYSNFQPGYSDMYDMMFTPNEAGQKSGRIVFSYEDDSGEMIEEYREFSVNVMEMGGLDMPDQGMEMTPVEEEKGIFGKIVDFIKKPVFIISASVAVVVIVLIIVLTVRRVRKKRREIDLDE